MATSAETSSRKVSEKEMRVSVSAFACVYVSLYFYVFLLVSLYLRCLTFLESSLQLSVSKNTSTNICKEPKKVLDAIDLITTTANYNQSGAAH